MNNKNDCPAVTHGSGGYPVVGRFQLVGGIYYEIGAGGGGSGKSGTIDLSDVAIGVKAEQLKEQK